MKTLDAAEGNVAKIAALFPQCITERIGKSGTAELAIDFDKLRDELSKDLLDGAEERYQFTWPDKRAASRLANAETDKTLRPDINASEDFWNTQNLYIEGDNLDVLKVLRENYLGAIKMIYIDPPYNTGNEFVYNDDFTESYEGFLESCKVYDENGNLQFDPKANGESNGRFHTDWLNMIYPRLKVARDLLADDGAIFISIDEHEFENLKKVCNEIFGPQNFVGNVIWERAFAPKNDAKYLSDSHDYVLIYAKSLSSFEIGLLPRTDEANSRYKNPDNDPRGPWTADNMTVKTYSANYDYPITTPSGKVVRPTDGRCWFTSSARMQTLIEQGRVWFGEDGGNMPRLKRYLSDVQQGMTPTTIWKYTEVGHNQEGRQEVKKLFSDKGYFDGPKPLRLLSRVLTLGNTSKNSIILDFFSGSATTAHAVMKLNAEDGGKRKFIMVQLPEVTDEKSEARKAGYKTICQIGEERIRRAGKKILEEVRSEKLGVRSDKAGNLFGKEDSSQLTSNSSLKDNSSLPDVGFRVLKLDSSNMEDVFYTPEDFDAKNIFTTVDNVKSDRTPLDLLFQVLPELNIELSAKIEEKEVNGKKVFFVDGNYLIATFDTEVNESTVTEIAKMKPQYFVMRDASAANDNVLDNFEQIFRHYSPETVRKII